MATGAEHWQVDEAVKQCRIKWIVRGDRKRSDEWQRYLRGAVTQISQNSEERAKLKRQDGEWRPPPVTPEQNAARIRAEEKLQQRIREENQRFIEEHNIVVPKTPEELATQMSAIMRGVKP